MNDEDAKITWTSPEGTMATRRGMVDGEHAFTIEQPWARRSVTLRTHVRAYAFGAGGPKQFDSVEEAQRFAAGRLNLGPIMVDVRSLLEQCEREDTNLPDRRFLFTEEIRRLLGLGFGPDFSKLAEAIEEDQRGE